MDSFVKTTKEFKKVDAVYDSEEIIKMNKIYLKHGWRWFS